MVAIIVILEIDPGKIDEFLEVIGANAAASREEPGCLRFDVSQHADQDNLVALSEAYVDKEAMVAHTKTPHFAVWREKSPGFVLKRWAVKGPVISPKPESGQ
jgi:autoinducer 2-degrading protein